MAEEELGANAILAQILEKLGEPDKDVSPGTVGGNIDKLKRSSAQLLRDIRAHNIKLLRAINKGNKTSETSAKATAKQTKGKNKSSSKDASPVKQSKKSDNALQTISDHLKDIKIFLKTQFKKEGLSGSDKPEKREALAASIDKKDKKEKEENKTSSLPWLAMLFAGGALAGITKVFGLGAGGGVAGGLLAKLLPKIFKVGKAVFKRIPIIGSLFSFYEAYKHFKAGGIDHIIFGLLDVVAGIAYMVPGIGTAIGLGVDVLSYFLQNKANEFKEEGGTGSFFGSLSKKVMDYLKKTPIFKWFTHLGEKGKAFWDDPSWETLKPFLLHFKGIFGALVSTFGMFNDDAGAALGLEDEGGQSKGLLGWIGEKVDEWIITPVMDFFGSVFKKVGEMMAKVNAGILGFIGRTIDNLKMPDWLRNQIKGALGLPSKEETEVANRRAEAEKRGIKIHGEGRAQGQRTTTAGGRLHADQAKQRKAERAGMSYGDFMSLDNWMDNLETGQGDKDEMYSGVKTLWQQHRFKEAAELRGQIMQKKSMETERVPSKFDLDATIKSKAPNQTQNNTSVNTNVYNNINEPSPSDVFNPGFIYRFSRP